MHLHQTIDENGKQLRRIVAFLLALADLAERAAGRSRAVCFLVLWLLRPGEAIARDYLDDIAPGAAVWDTPEPLRPDDGAVEALRLARSFRALAAALMAFAQECFANWHAGAVRWLDTAPTAQSAPTVRCAHVAAVGRRDSS